MSSRATYRVVTSSTLLKPKGPPWTIRPKIKFSREIQGMRSDSISVRLNCGL
ncbi:hypothetical protein Mapa_000429 [Marchantia paleacea]|nr:hypothetical protein Mapa_000429 [Marchantia paleacea]